MDIDVSDAEQLLGESDLKEYATPEGLLRRDEIQSTVIRAMEKLPDDLRKAIMLRELEGLSYDEIAEEMQCPVGTIRSRIFRAREAIQNELEPLLD
jgi:RNA polymerase sigma-70 factor (ECF subfamily)